LSKASIAEKASEQVGALRWMSWLSIWIAAAGTLVMGTVLPFWLVNLAQQAAGMMLR
jgi:NADH-quinone oxidoreductase subunit N